MQVRSLAYSFNQIKVSTEKHTGILQYQYQSVGIIMVPVLKNIKRYPALARMRVLFWTNVKHSAVLLLQLKT